jgi:putative chitinase
MRLTEITTVEEGVKDWLGKAALATALTLSPAASAAANTTAGQTASQQASTSPQEAEKILMKTAQANGLHGAELAAFMAQCAHETLNFRHMSEIGGSLDFRKYDPASRKVLDRRKAKQLGNVKAGDGARYRGRGFIQLTGRDNYRRAGDALGLDLEKHPDLVERPSVAARVAIWFWKNRVQPDVDDFHNVQAVTQKINPGLHGLESRRDFFNDYRQKINQMFGKQKPTADKKTPPPAQPPVRSVSQPDTKPSKTGHNGWHSYNTKTGKWDY